jgi:1-acyl-sn-glycerol-3-phosphate acyltransferase
VLALWRTTSFTFPQAALYLVALFLTRLLWRTKVRGAIHLPAGQGAVVVANHRSSVDPIFIQLGTTRIVRWMVAKEYCEHPALRWLFRAAQSIPVGRGGVDTAATKSAIRECAAGGLIGMFPEGRLNQTEQLMLPGRTGVALIALKAGVPIIPCYIRGAPNKGSVYSPLFMTAKVEVVFGEPIDLSSYVACKREPRLLEEITLQAMTALARLSGDEEFHPSVQSAKQWTEGLNS